MFVGKPKKKSPSAIDGAFQNKMNSIIQSRWSPGLMRTTVRPNQVQEAKTTTKKMVVSTSESSSSTTNPLVPPPPNPPNPHRRPPFTSIKQGVAGDPILGPTLQRMKRNRKRVQATGSVAVGAVSFFLVGPVGAVAAGLAASLIIRNVAKRRERKWIKNHQHRVEKQQHPSFHQHQQPQDEPSVEKISKGTNDDGSAASSEKIPFRQQLVPDGDANSVISDLSVSTVHHPHGARRSPPPPPLVVRATSLKVGDFVFQGSSLMVATIPDTGQEGQSNES